MFAERNLSIAIGEIFVTGFSSVDTRTTKLGNEIVASSMSLSSSSVSVYMSCFVFSPVQCSITHYRVHFFSLEIHQGGNPFTLVETGICFQYTYVGRKTPSTCHSQVFSIQYLVPYNLIEVQITLSVEGLGTCFASWAIEENDRDNQIRR